MSKFISFDVESESKLHSGVFILYGHLFENEELVQELMLRRKFDISENKWINDNVLSNIRDYGANCNSVEDIFGKFFDFYVDSGKPDIITYCSEPYEKWFINYLDSHLVIGSATHLDLYNKFPDEFSEFENLERFLINSGKSHLVDVSQRHNPKYDSRIVGETFIELMKQ